MNTPLSSFAPRAGWLALGALASLLAACSTVDLGQRYVPPPVRMPGDAPAGAAPVPQTPAEMPLSQPVDSARPESSALPPLGSSQAPADADAHLLTFSTQLNAQETLPFSGSMAHGQIDAVYDANTRLLRWKASWSALSSPITGIAFHGPAQPGQTAPQSMTWPGPFGPHYEGRATLTPQQAADLQQGAWYLNVSTQNWPQGEIRGQMRVVR